MSSYLTEFSDSSLPYTSFLQQRLPCVISPVDKCPPTLQSSLRLACLIPSFCNNVSLVSYAPVDKCPPTLQSSLILTCLIPPFCNNVSLVSYAPVDKCPPTLQSSLSLASRMARSISLDLLVSCS